MKDRMVRGGSAFREDPKPVPLWAKRGRSNGLFRAVVLYSPQRRTAVIGGKGVRIFPSLSRRPLSALKLSLSMSRTSSQSEPSPQQTAQVALNAVLAEVEKGARASDRFGAVILERSVPRLRCAARGADASYELEPHPARAGQAGGPGLVLWLSLVMTDRYLSQSIEQDLVHSGDKLSDLYRDELIDAGYPADESDAAATQGGKDGAPMLPFEHFRDQQKRFTFRVAVPGAIEELAGVAGPAGASVTGGGLNKLSNRILKMLLAMEAMFSPLGGMSGGEDD